MNPNTKAFLACNFALIPFLVSCSSTGRPIDQTKVMQIKRGETTQAQVIELLGKPSAVGYIDNAQGRGTVLTYNYELSIARPESILPYANLFGGGAEHSKQTATIILNSDGIVDSIAVTSGTENSNAGFGTRISYSGTNNAKAVPGKRGSH